MDIKLKKFIGTPIKDFETYFREEKGVSLRYARLIPLQKTGDEIALTSIFLSAIRLIKEFRNDIFGNVSLPKSGKVYVYTEIEFPKSEIWTHNRPDGLILIEKKGLIVEAALLEVKNKNNLLDTAQIEDYIKIAKEYNIPKIVTISNQFVSKPTQTPIKTRVPKKIELYHLSWTYILTLARILLFKNDHNIEDTDQIEIMKEITLYLEHKDSGISGFTQMPKEWSETVSKINSGAHLKENSNEVVETVEAWIQEERDMALILSRHLGVLVNSGEKIYKNNLVERVKAEQKRLVSSNLLKGTFDIANAASNIVVLVNLEKRNIEMQATLKAPEDKTIVGQIGWIKRQIESCKTKELEIFEKNRNELKLDILIKHTSKPFRITSLDELDNFPKENKGKMIKEFRIIQIKDLGRTFESRKKFIEIIELMLEEFYQGIMQHLKAWQKPAPKISKTDVAINKSFEEA